MKRTTFTTFVALLFCAGCGAEGETPDFGDQDFKSDSFGDGGDGNSFFDEGGDASTTSTGDAGAADAGLVDAPDGAAGCHPDPAEPDSEAATATSLGEFSDSKKTTQELTVHSLHDSGDEDWFLLEIDDTLDFSNPEPEVSVSGLTADDTYEVAGWYTCDEGGDVDCEEGTSDETFGFGCAATGSGDDGVLMKLKSKCDGTDESGTLLVRIRALEHSGSCAPYVIRFRVD